MLNGSFSKRRKKSALSDFLEKNKSLVYTVPIMLIGIIVVVIMYSKPQNQPKPVQPVSSGEKAPGGTQTSDAIGLQVEVLPQMERIKQPENLNLSEINDPFNTDEPSVYLKGTMLSDKQDTAIIETDGRAYIVSVGDSIGAYWVVEKIEDKKVTLVDTDGDNLVLTLH